MAVAAEQLALMGRHILQVKGMPMDVSCTVVALLGCIVRNGLITGFRRAF